MSLSSWSTEEDLIDFEVGSPDLPQGALSSTTLLLDSECLPRTLLDSELFHLEETLQTASSSPQKPRSRCDSRDSVELEQILITIDDDLCRNACSSRKNSLDVSNALEELDKIINESTNSTNFTFQDESKDEVDGLVNEDLQITSVEDCLRELDNYLQGFDTSGSDVVDLENTPELNKDVKPAFTEKLRRLASRSRSLHNGRQNPGFEPTENESKRPISADCNLKRSHPYRNTIEARHSSSKRPFSADLDDSYISGRSKEGTRNERPFSADLEDSYSFGRSKREKLEKPRHGRPLSADLHSSGRSKGKVSTNLDQTRSARPFSADMEESYSSLRSKRTISTDLEDSINLQNSFKRNNKFRQSHDPTNFRRNKVRPFSADGQSLKRNHKFRSTIAGITRSHQNSVTNLTNIEPEMRNDTSYETEDEEIDWSWVHDMTENNDEARTIEATENETQEAPLPEVLLKDDVIEATSTPWLRSSMRRLRHIRLPSNHPSPINPNPVSSTPTLLAATSLAAQPVALNPATARPVSAPVTVTRARSESESSRSRSRSRQSRARSLSSSESSLDSVESGGGTDREEREVGPEGSAAQGQGQGQTAGQRRPCDSTQPPTMPETRSPLGQWPHGLSSMLACLGCTLGLFNLSRFATLTVRFGANFIIQFLVLSMVFGIPLFTLQLCLGQQLSAGVVDMWRISPLFQGVGIALLAAQALIGLYSIVGVSWMFIYFRDSFITKQDQYKWAEPYEAYREESRSGLNGTYKISETVPDYFNGVVLQRHNLVTGNSFGAIKFQVAFNLAVVWMIVFVSLSKGLRSYAKVVYVFSLLPIFGTFVLCAKLLGMSPTDTLHEVFPATAWGEFFVNTKSWIAASQECFLTWGLLGAAVMQLSSHNKHKHLLQRDSSLVIILTITILMLTAFLANTCIEILHAYGYNYMPNSFERISTYVFLRSNKDPLPPSLSSTPVRYMTHSSFIIGERVMRPGMDKTMESGYQVLRFATELFPATLAILGPTQISPFWAVLFYFILILFGIAQQLAIWHCVITGIMAIKAKVLKSWETTITFFTCTFGFILGLPMTTEFGIFVVYFLDYCVGGAWWLVFVYLLQIVAVFMIRGRPYSGDTVVTALFTSSTGTCMQAWLAPLLSFIWNVVLPVALMVVCITQFKSGNFRELFIWHHAPSADYWPLWTRQVGSLLQLTPILCIPIVAIVQSYRYLNNGPPDILDRIQLLYRPPLDSEHMDDLAIQQAAATANAATTTTANIPAEDPPPKYTPPPSYTTATGARIAKMLRQSIRRSVRRLANVLGEGSAPRSVDRPHLQVPPPDYSAVLVEMNQSQTEVPHVTIDVTDSQNGSQQTQNDRISRELSSLQQGSPLTAADVASILRSSFRRSTVRNAQRMRRSAPEEIPSGSLSAECLVDGVAPLGEDSLVLETISTGESESKGGDNRSSVI